MDGTPGTSQLFANIQFDEAKKGYDRDQVTNFLKELSTKIGELQDMLRESTARAEAAEARAAEATKAKVLAETMAEKAKADADKAKEAAPEQPVNEVEAAAGMLALAQQTAEAAIAAAEARGKEVIADARSKAAMIVVEVEQEVERIKSRAVEEADALVAGRAEAVEAEVKRLSELRDGLQTDVDLLQRHLDEHRTRLRDGVDALAKLLDGGSFDPIGGGDGGGAKPASSIFDTPDASSDADDTIDVTDTAVSAEADDAGEPLAVSDVHDAIEPDAARADAPDADQADAAPAELPHIEFVPEPEPAPVALNLVPPRAEPDIDLDAAVDASGDEGPSSTEPEPEPEPASDERRPTELTIVTLADLVDGADTEPSSFAPPPADGPDTSERVAQIPNLLEAPAEIAVPEPAIVLDAPLFPDLGTSATDAGVEAPAANDEQPEPEPEAAEAQPEPVAEPVAEATPIVIAPTGTDGASRGGAPVVNLTAAKLFGEPAIEGDPTQAFDVLADDAPSPRLILQRSEGLPSTADSSPLGEPDADADAAMRAFFEQDLNKLEREQKGRFLRRK